MFIKILSIQVTVATNLYSTISPSIKQGQKSV